MNLTIKIDSDTLIAFFNGSKGDKTKSNHCHYSRQEDSYPAYSDSSSSSSDSSSDDEDLDLGSVDDYVEPVFPSEKKEAGFDLLGLLQSNMAGETEGILGAVNSHMNNMKDENGDNPSLIGAMQNMISNFTEAGEEQVSQEEEQVKPLLQSATKATKKGGRRQARNRKKSKKNKVLLEETSSPNEEDMPECEGTPPMIAPLSSEEKKNLHDAMLSNYKIFTNDDFMAKEEKQAMLNRVIFGEGPSLSSDRANSIRDAFRADPKAMELVSKSSGIATHRLKALVVSHMREAQK